MRVHGEKEKLHQAVEVRIDKQMKQLGLCLRFSFKSIEINYSQTVVGSLVSTLERSTQHAGNRKQFIPL